MFFFCQRRANVLPWGGRFRLSCYIIHTRFLIKYAANTPKEYAYWIVLFNTQTWSTYQPTNNCYSRLNVVWITWLWLDGDNSRARALLHRLKLGFVKIYLFVVYLFAFSVFLDTVSCFGGSRKTRMWPQPPISIIGSLFAFVVVGIVLS